MKKGAQREERITHTQKSQGHSWMLSFKKHSFIHLLDEENPENEFLCWKLLMIWDRTSDSTWTRFWEILKYFMFSVWRLTWQTQGCCFIRLIIPRKIVEQTLLSMPIDTRSQGTEFPRALLVNSYDTRFPCLH